MKHKLKTCKMCTNKVPKPSWLSIPRYKERKFCSRKCYFKYMRENKEGWWGKKLDFRNRRITKEDKLAIDALTEFGYIKEGEVLLPQEII